MIYEPFVDRVSRLPHVPYDISSLNSYSIDGSDFVSEKVFIFDVNSVNRSTGYFSIVVSAAVSSKLQDLASLVDLATPLATAREFAYRELIF